MRNFDADHDARRAARIDPDNLTFRINERDFHVVSGYAPDAPGESALAAWRAADFENLTDPDFAALADQTILNFLTPGQEELWREARDPKAENPITGHDLVDVVTWLVESVVNRPLEPASGSSNGSTPPTAPASPAPPAPIGKRLTVGSSSRAEGDSEA